jgi:hypothetical protein
MNTYKTIIVDDERLAREEVKRALLGRRSKQRR